MADDGIRARAERVVQETFGTRNGLAVKIAEAAIRDQSSETARLRGALQQIASTRIAGWGADGAVKSFNDVIAFAARSLESK